MLKWSKWFLYFVLYFCQRSFALLRMPFNNKNGHMWNSWYIWVTFILCFLWYKLLQSSFTFALLFCKINHLWYKVSREDCLIIKLNLVHVLFSSRSGIVWGLKEDQRYLFPNTTEQSMQMFCWPRGEHILFTWAVFFSGFSLGVEPSCTIRPQRLPVIWACIYVYVGPCNVAPDFSESYLAVGTHNSQKRL